MTRVSLLLTLVVLVLACTDRLPLQSSQTPTAAPSGCPNYADPTNCPPFSTDGSRVVTGTVSEFSDNLERHPVSGLRVWVWAQLNGHGFGMASVVTDATGGFRVQNVPDGFVILEAVGGPLDQPCAAAASTIGHDAEVSVELVPPTLPSPSLTVAPTTIRGIVFETTALGRKALPGAHVTLESPVDIPVASVTTDSAGRYNLCGLPFGSGAALIARKSSYDEGAKGVPIGVNLTVDLELVRSDTSGLE